MSRNVIALLLATFLVIVGAILGFHALGSPFTQRMIRTDTQTLQLMRGISAQFHTDWSVSKKILPSDLSGLLKSQIEDPTSHQQILYRRISDTQYQLCATFMLESRSIQGLDPNEPSGFWSHPKGYYCFQFDATQSAPFFANGDFSGFD